MEDKLTLFSLIQTANISEVDRKRLNKELEDLVYDAEKLAVLEMFGVDNWAGYGQAMEELENNSKD